MEDFWIYPEESAFRDPRGILNGAFPTQMLHTSGIAKQAVIGKLSHLDMELKELAKSFTLHTPEITDDHLLQLNIMLLSKLKQVSARD